MKRATTAVGAIVMLWAMSGCSGSTSGDAERGGGLALQIRWQDEEIATAVDSCEDGTDEGDRSLLAELPQEVQTVRLLLDSSTGFACCLAVSRREVEERGRLVLANLPEGEACFSVNGFTSDRAPADGREATCKTSGSEIGRACDPELNQAPLFCSVPRRVQILSGLRASAGTVRVGLCPGRATATPTETPTATPTPSETGTPSPSATPTHTPTVTPEPLEVALVTNFADGTVSVINTADESVVTIQVGRGPQGVALRADGTRAYVANSGTSTISVINTQTRMVETEVVSNQLQRPTGVALHPVNPRLFVTNFASDTVSMIDTTTNSVTGAPIDLKESSMDMGAAVGIAVTPDGEFAYVATTTGVRLINVADDAAAARGVIARDAIPAAWISASPAGDFVYTSATARGVTVAQTGDVAYLTHDPRDTLQRYRADGSASDEMLLPSAFPLPPGPVSGVSLDGQVSDVSSNAVAPAGVALTLDDSRLLLTSRTDQGPDQVFIIGIDDDSFAVIPVGLDPRAIVIGNVPRGGSR